MKTLENLADRQEIRGRLLALTAMDEGQWGMMTVGQGVCHMRGAFLMAMSDAEVLYLKAPIPHGVLKRIALHAPIPWARNFPTVPALKIGMPALQTDNFAADHASLVEAYERFCSFPQHTRDHAYFHAMTHADWMRWGYLHIDHHLRQFGR